MGCTAARLAFHNPRRTDSAPDGAAYLAQPE